MENRTSPSGAYHLLLFLFLSALLLVSAAHLLETVCFSVGLVHLKPLSQQDPLATPPVSKALLVYRVLAAITCLFLAYHCLGLKDWSRRWLVRVLAVDLVVGLAWSVQKYLLDASLVVAPERLTVQVLAVALEGGLVWILTHPEAIRHFAPEPNNGSILPT